MIDKTYQPSEVEGRTYAAWEQSGAFRAGRPERRDAEPFCIVIPPPNVTGSLHMGHALNNTLQDILCRFERMRGKDVLWQPGTDHAGIATQMVVERQLMERQQPGRREMGREAFLKRVWDWKEESGGTIINQLKRLGASCDWSRERFTMDEGLSRAVLKVFVELYREGLIYKDKRLVNWDPKLLTAISDLEVVQVEVKGHLWHLRYPIEGKIFDPNDPSTFIVVATTRPETMLGDTAVAVHPDDERYKALIGKNVILPLVGRRIPIIADEYSDPEKGSGAVKITPAHDFNDFEVGKRHNLAQVNVLTVDGKITFADGAFNRQGGEAFAETRKLEGLDRFAARKQIVPRLEENGLVEKIEPHTHAVPHGDRSNVVIEPYLTDQWYVDAKTLAQPAIKAVREDRTTFIPKNWEKTYFDWMENIQPWCISRQLWWGHQIPAWYGPDGKVFVALGEKDAQAQADKHYGEAAKLTRDEDVLDTWFSSALWPFSTLGWPDETPEVKRYYPTSVLVTGFDIIFFWVARMMMMGLHFQKEIPFKDVYIHRLVRDASGAKMSKSKGNVVDPLGVIDEFGADALRFTLARNVAPGHDIRLGPQDVENNRNFATKLWNAARFAEMNACESVEGFDPKSAKETLNRWIAHETAKAASEITAAIQAYKFNDAAGEAYRFVWNIYCDWYLELAKPVLLGPDGAAKSETRAMVAWARDEILKLLHPFMPFITEELWAVTSAKRAQLLALTDWPKLDGLADERAEAEIGWVIDLVTAIRSVRAEMNITTQIPLVLAGASTDSTARAERWVEFIKRLARVSEISSAAAAPQGSVQLVVRGEVAALPLKGVIDLAAERARLDKELAKADADIKRVDAKLSNEKFVANAPEEIIEGEKEKRQEAEDRRSKILEALERLKAAIDEPNSGSAMSPWEKRDYSIFVLGAGFSAQAGLPVANELWSEVRQRAEKLEGRAEKFKRDLEDFIEYRAKCGDKQITLETINFEEFLGYLDLEFHLGLRGKDTWSVEGNETQIVVKTLIGQILAERMPRDIPELYLNFASKLKPSDLVLSFNYDVLLERALERLNKPYRLFPHRFKSVSPDGSGTIDNEKEEIVILKLHGSIDWFDRGRYGRREQTYKLHQASGHPPSPIFHPASGIELAPLVQGVRPHNDPLKEIYRVGDIDAAYSKNLMFFETPLIIPPSSTKVLWFEKFKDFWWGMDSAGSLNFRMAIIGLSLTPHDDYARQIIYWIVRNYQEVEWGKEISGKTKRPLLLVDYRKTAADKESYHQRYSFVDWNKTQLVLDGFSASVLSDLY